MLKNFTKIQFWILFGLQLIAGGVRSEEDICPWMISNAFEDWLNEDGSLRFPTFRAGNVEGEPEAAYVSEDNDAFHRVKPTSGKTDSCHYSEATNDIACKGLIDFNYLKNFRGERIRTFTLDSYNKRKISNLRNGIRRMMRPSSSDWEQKITGELILQDINVEFRTVLDIIGKNDSNMKIRGDAFSNKHVKLGWKYNGEIQINGNEELCIYVEMSSNGFEVEWKIHGVVVLEDNDGTITGNVTHIHDSSPTIVVHGTVRLTIEHSEVKIIGRIIVKDVNVVGDFFGRIKEDLTLEATIPRGAFSGMNIGHFHFKNSDFFGDFERHSFEGIQELETITFSKSNMELMNGYETIFSTPSLKAFYIEDCNTPRDTGYNFQCEMKNLELISFKGSGFLELSEVDFDWLSCSNITYVNFHDTNVKLIGNESILKPVRGTVKYLDISYSALTDELSIRQILKGLKVTHLSLAGLRLKSVPKAALQEVKDTVEFLSMRMNSLQKIPSKNILVQVLEFPPMTALKELDLRRCEINYIEKGAFNNMNNLRKLDVSYNNIMNIQDGWTSVTPNVLFLNMSQNGLVTKELALNHLDVENTLDLGIMENLEILILSKSTLAKDTKIILGSNKNLQRLSLCKCRLKSLNNLNSLGTDRLQELDLSGNPKLGSFFGFQPLKRMKSLKKLHLTHNRIATLELNSNGKDDTMNLEYLDLSVNYIRFVPSDILKLCPRLKTLVLSHNSISTWSSDFFIGQHSLRSLYLDNNVLEDLNSLVISDIYQLNEISFGNNLFACDCCAIEISEKLTETELGHYLCPEGNFDNSGNAGDTGTVRQQIEDVLPKTGENVRNSTWTAGLRSRYGRDCVLIKYWNEFNYRCYSRSQGKLIPFGDVKENSADCSINEEEYFNWFFIAIIISTIGIIVALTWWKWWHFRHFVKIIRNAVILTYVNRDSNKLDVPFKYDAFISYSDCDRLWVIENLIPNLENINNVKICLHERDFQVGLSVLENIITCIDKSKYIILVLSQSFVQSRWCQYEMHLAYHRLLETKRDHMILILLEDIPHIIRPRTLQYLMMTKTYIQWPASNEDAKDLIVFWNRLFKALL